MPEIIVNMSDGRSKTAVLNRVAKLEGMYRIEVSKYRRRRSDRQNRYYWPCFVHSLGEFLRGQGETLTDEDCHELLKHKFLRISVVNRKTGQPLTYTQSTTKLTIGEFNEYLDRCAQWLVETFGIRVPDPSEYHERVNDDRLPCRTTYAYSPN